MLAVPSCGRGSPVSEPELDAEDIQGNILPGFRREQQLLVAFASTDEAALRAALALISDAVTDLATVLDHKDDRKQALLKGAMPARRGDLWLNYALGASASARLGLARLQNSDTSFAGGMDPSRTGDPTNAALADGSPNPAAPANWVAGGPSTPIDLFLIFAADDNVRGRSDAMVHEIEAAGLRLVYIEEGHPLAGDKEHFGFQDGVSQPGVYGTVRVGGTQRFVTTRYGIPQSRGVDFGKPGQPLQDPFQFLFDAADADLANGSFLVFRRLEQDVAGFYADTINLAAKLAAAQPGLAPEELRAKIVGRWPSGQPLMRASAEPHDAEPPLALNYFEFGRDVSELVLATGDRISGAAGDPHVQSGARCPVWAHIRKVNPRDLQTDKGGPDDTRGFQMLRRGIPYGPAYDHTDPTNPINIASRGLLFIAYQRSITDQFETLNSNWMNNASAPAAFGYDLLVGQHRGVDGRYAEKEADFFSSATHQPQRFASLSQWVRPTGGAYLFAPSISWTRRNAAGSIPTA
jgi:Dyp-type peroxidase family